MHRHLYAAHIRLAIGRKSLATAFFSIRRYSTQAISDDIAPQANTSTLAWRFFALNSASETAALGTGKRRFMCRAASTHPVNPLKIYCSAAATHHRYSTDATIVSQQVQRGFLFTGTYQHTPIHPLKIDGSSAATHHRYSADATSQQTQRGFLFTGTHHIHPLKIRRFVAATLQKHIVYRTIVSSQTEYKSHRQSGSLFRQRRASTVVIR